MSDIGDSVFHKGQAIWVLGPDGSARAAEYVGEGELSSWFGGPQTVIAIYPTRGRARPSRSIASSRETTRARFAR